MVIEHNNDLLPYLFWCIENGIEVDSAEEYKRNYENYKRDLKIKKIKEKYPKN